MKKAKFIRALLYGLMAFAFYNCSDVLPQSESIADCGTRALVSDAEDGFYYYYKGEKIPLPVSATKRYVVTKTSGTTPYSTRNAESRIIDLDNHSGISTQSQDNQLAELSNDDNVVAVEYVVGDSIPRAISNLFYIKLKNESDISVLEEEAEKIGCKVENRVASDPLWVRLSNDKNSMYPSSLEASNHLYETGRFADVDPGFIFNFQYNRIPTDERYSEQWGMGYKGINVENVWNTNKGKPYITTAIVDVGIYKQHPDLVGVMHPYSYDCATGSNNTTPQNHATMIAGIIAANHNTIGVAGIAPETKLMDICAPPTSDLAFNEKLTNGINMAWQHDADIINMSIGDQAGVLYDYFHSALLESALDNALTKGRNGKGCVFVFASGNHNVVDYPGYANKDILVVGSISEDGQLVSYSGRGAALDVVAPGLNILSTGWSKRYISDSGTSFAAPHAAGLAALILSEDSTLTQQQVCKLIVASAKNSTWNPNSGYGCINADKAFKILRQQYFTIRSRRRGNGIHAFGNSEYYVTNYSESDIQWSQEGGIDLRPWPATNSVIVNPDFDGYSKDITLKANFTYKGYPISISSSFKLAKDPIIYGIEKLELYSTDDMWSFKINCADPNAEAICTGDNVIEFPYATDADFIGTDPSLYFSIDRSWGKKNEYKVAIQTKNKYTGDQQEFVITSGTDKIDAFKAKPDKPVE